MGHFRLFGRAFLAAGSRRGGVLAGPCLQPWRQVEPVICVGESVSRWCPSLRSYLAPHDGTSLAHAKGATRCMRENTISQIPPSTAKAAIPGVLLELPVELLTWHLAESLVTESSRQTFSLLSQARRITWAF